MVGAFFEGFVIAEIIKSYYNKGTVEPPLYFYRDKDMNEIDLVIEENGTLYPLEMKKHIRPMRSAPLGGGIRRLGDHNRQSSSSCISIRSMMCAWILL